MNKMFLVAALSVVIGCSETETKPASEPPSTESSKPEEANTVAPVPQVKSCEVDDTKRFGDCTVYMLLCDDLSREYYFGCETHPMGEITNPPNPVVYEPWESKTALE